MTLPAESRVGGTSGSADGAPRWMAAHDRIRLTGLLPGAPPRRGFSFFEEAAFELVGVTHPRTASPRTPAPRPARHVLPRVPNEAVPERLDRDRRAQRPGRGARDPRPHARELRRTDARNAPGSPFTASRVHSRSRECSGDWQCWGAQPVTPGMRSGAPRMRSATRARRVRTPAPSNGDVEDDRAGARPACATTRRLERAAATRSESCDAPAQPAVAQRRSGRPVMLRRPARGRRRWRYALDAGPASRP